MNPPLFEAIVIDSSQTAFTRGQCMFEIYGQLKIYIEHVMAQQNMDV